jgi:hypothetical protein
VSDSAADTSNVTGPAAGDERIDDEALADDDRGDGETTSADEYATEGQPSAEETLEQAIARLQVESQKAQEAKEAADSRVADADGRLTALRNLQRDSEKARLAYESAREQLEIDQQGYRDFYESEEESLAKLLGPEAVAEVKKKSDDRQAAYDAAKAAVEAKKADLAAAEERRDAAAAVRKEKADQVSQYKALATTIGGRHAQLKAMRDEVTKARQAGQYALAYWLLELRDFRSVLDKGARDLIDPEELPAKLLAAVNELGDAERDYAASESAVGKRRIELAAAEKELADQKAQGETRLRDQLKQIAAANS